METANATAPPDDAVPAPLGDTAQAPLEGAGQAPLDDAAQAPASDAVQVPEPPAVYQHQIQPGDTLLGLAVKYGVSMAAIQLANGMGNSIDLVAGETLTIPSSTQWLDEGFFWVVHVVNAGDTLVDLASAYDLTVEEILRVNAVADPDLIHVDQQLVVPLTQLVTLKRPQPTAPPAVVAAAPETPKSPEGTTEGDAGADIAAATLDTPAAGAEPEAEPTAVPPVGPPAGPGDWPTYILARINQVRAEHGLTQLTPAPELNGAAQAHAEDCARRGWGSHVGSDGAVLQTRLARVGYTGRYSGENWVQARGAERAFDWWYGEIPPNDPHRRNILSPNYTQIGIGIARMTNGYIFITDFGRP
jgi:uncharacterized protein YkwD